MQGAQPGIGAYSFPDQAKLSLEESARRAIEPVTTFQFCAWIAIGIWLTLVATRFRRSIPVLLGGLIAAALATLAALATKIVTRGELGLDPPESWPRTIGLALAWTALMVSFSPLADRMATRLFEKPPELEAFRSLQQSKAKLIAGIVVAWILGGFLEELVFRGIVLNSIHSYFALRGLGAVGAFAGIVVAACGAGFAHLYQGNRAALIITQLSCLFGLLFVLSGYNLWAVILCHGFYDTIALIRFALRKSKYSRLDERDAPPLRFESSRRRRDPRFCKMSGVSHDSRESR